MSTEASLRVAVVGAGLMGRWHACYAARHGARVVAVVDSVRGAAETLARTCANATAFEDMGTMLAAIRPRVVHVCTPLGTHLPFTLQAIEAGAHALVEKPLAPTAGETRMLLDRARERGLHVCPVHQFAFQGGVERAARALAGLGEALSASFTISSAGGGSADGPALDAIVADILPHPLSVLQALWPDNCLRPGDWTARRTRQGELHVQGGSADIAVDVHVSLHARPTRCDLDIQCRGGGIHLDFFHGFAVVSRGTVSRFDKVAQPFRFAGKSLAVAAANLAGRALRRESAYPGLSTLIGRFYAAVAGTQGNPVPGQDTLAAAQVREHLIRLAMPGLAPAAGADGAPQPVD